jgi:hypothetical protein
MYLKLVNEGAMKAGLKKMTFRKGAAAIKKITPYSLLMHRPDLRVLKQHTLYTINKGPTGILKFKRDTTNKGPAGHLKFKRYTINKSPASHLKFKRYH